MASTMQHMGQWHVNVAAYRGDCGATVFWGSLAECEAKAQELERRGQWYRVWVAC